MASATEDTATRAGADGDAPNIWDLARRWTHSTSGTTHGTMVTLGDKAEASVWSTWEAVGLSTHNPATDEYQRWLEFVVTLNVSAPAECAKFKPGLPLKSAAAHFVPTGGWTVFDSKPDTYRGKTTVTKSESVSFGVGTELGFDGGGNVGAEHGATMGTSVSWGIPDLVYQKQGSLANPGWELRVATVKHKEPPPVAVGTLTQPLAWIWTRSYESKEEAAADTELTIHQVVTPSYALGKGFKPVTADVTFPLPALPDGD